jgi:predicted HicB family RNase H-like nuclease
MSTLTYKGYQGRFEFDEEADIFHGQVMNLSDVITFQGRSIDELKQALADSVEDYLEFCAKEDKAPEKL